MQRLLRRSGGAVTGGVTSRFVSSNPFKGGKVVNEAFQLKSNYTLWRPSDRWMAYRPVRFIYDNIFIIATYQLFLEFSLTAAFGLLLWNKVCTGEQVKTWMEEHYYPFASWIELENTEFKDPVMVGPKQLNSEKLTAAYTGHNIASGLLPIQVVFLVCTFPLVLKGFGAWLKWMGKPPRVPTPAPATIAKAKAKAPEPSAPSREATTPRRRASYARPTTTPRRA